MKIKILVSLFIIAGLIFLNFSYQYLLNLIENHRFQSLIMLLITLGLSLYSLVIGISLIKLRIWAWNLAATTLIPTISGSIFSWLQTGGFSLLPVILTQILSLYLLIQIKPLFSNYPVPGSSAPLNPEPIPGNQYSPKPNSGHKSAFLNPFGTIKTQKKLST